MKIILPTLFLFIGAFTFAQDSIIKTDGTQLNVKVTEVSDTHLKYQKPGLSVAFSLPVTDVVMVVFQNGEKLSFNNATQNVLNNVSHVAPQMSGATGLISSGTRIPLVMSETISSDNKGGRKVNTGEMITLTVQTDITDMNGNVVIKQGTLVNGFITNADKRKIAGTKGKLSFSVDNVKAIDGQSVPVTLRHENEGKSKTGVAIGAAAVVAAPLILIKGKPAVIQAGSVFHALVIGDKKIRLQ